MKDKLFSYLIGFCLIFGLIGVAAFSYVLGGDRLIGGRSADTDGVGVVLYDADSARSASLDGSSDALQTIGYKHHEIHAGNAYVAHDLTDLGANVNKVYYMATNTVVTTDKYPHLNFGFTSEAEAEVIIYEVISVGTSTTGTEVPSYNRRRPSSKTPDWEIMEDAYATATGTLAIYGKHVGGAFNVGYEISNDAEIILDNDKAYVFSITNNTAGANQVTMMWSWYEHTDKVSVTGG